MTTHSLSIDSSALNFDIVIPSLIAANVKQAVRHTAHEVANHIGISERILAERLIEKERTNPSAMGDGIAITHLHISGLNDPVHVFVRLKTPVAMGAPDSRDVDLVCLLLTPEREGASYLRTMARLSRLLRNTHVCAQLRAASTEQSIRAVFEQTAVQPMAA